MRNIREDSSLDALNTAKAHIASILNGFLRICERGGKILYEMMVRIKTMEEELQKQAKKEKRSNVILFVSWELIVALLFAFMCPF
jgi:hypothetical protein